MGMSKVSLYSEVDPLEGVILHPPGPEVENMTPANAERALYSDILNLAVAKKEYTQFKSILDKLTQTFSVEDLLREVLQDEQAKDRLLRKICANECVQNLVDDLMQLQADVLAQQLIQG